MSGLETITKERRIAALLEIIAAKMPDVVALQEVTPEFLHGLFAHPILGQYHVIEPDFEDVGYGVAILCLAHFQDAVFVPLPSTQGRGLLRVDFEGWSVATVHLESMRHKSAHRLTQLEQIQDQLEDAAELVLLGDFNFGMRSREQAFLETLEFGRVACAASQ